jgi:hypothetical protein
MGGAQSNKGAESCNPLSTATNSRLKSKHVSPKLQPLAVINCLSSKILEVMQRRNAQIVKKRA